MKSNLLKKLKSKTSFSTYSDNLPLLAVVPAGFASGAAEAVMAAGHLRDEHWTTAAGVRQWDPPILVQRETMWRDHRPMS